MKCPKCMETVNETHLFCWNCGVNLAKARADRFALYKNNQKQDFLSWCEKKSGTKFCKGILGKAAWMIATNSEDKREFLDGEKMGTTESYAVLHDSIISAQHLFFVMDAMRKAHFECDTFAYRFTNDGFMIISFPAEKPSEDEEFPYRMKTGPV